MAATPITATSTPDYNSWGLFGTWTCADWITFHQALVAANGKAAADQTWLADWNGQSSFANDYNWCAYEPDFNAYVQAQGLPVTDTITNAGAAVGNVTNNLLNAGVSASAGVSNIANVIAKAVPVLIVVAILGAIWYFGKRYNLFSLKA